MSAKDIIEHLGLHKHMQFAPVQEDDDELSQSIKDDPQTHDNVWELKDSIDAEQLDNFWTEAVRELEPEDRQFADTEDR